MQELNTPTGDLEPMSKTLNGPLLEENLKSAIKTAFEKNQHLAVCRLDLEGISNIDQRIGIDNRDRLLTYFSQRIQSHLRQSDTLTRLENEKFVILISNVDDKAACVATIERIIKRIREPYVIDDLIVTISATAGITTSRNHTAAPELLIDQAIQALFSAKKQGSGSYSIFD